MTNGPKIMTASVVGLLLSLGLCGVGVFAGKVSGFFIGGGALLLVLSIIGFVIGFIWAIVAGFTK